MQDPFLNDGCTGFIEGLGDTDWSDCCAAHDVQFLQGQTVEDFWVANQELRECVSGAAAGDPLIWLISMAMFLAVCSPIGFLFFKRGKWQRNDAING